MDLPIAGDSSPAGESEIIDTAVRFIKDYLHEDLGRIDEEKRSQIDRLVQSKSPQHRMLLNKHPDVYDEIPTGLSDDWLDLELHKHQQKWEPDVARRGQDIKRRAKRSAAIDPSFEALIEEYCQSITDLSRASLAEYVAKRKTVIDLLEEALELDDAGKYGKELRIHSIICPMQATSDDVAFYCYVVADITRTLQRSARGAGLIPTQDGGGYFGYNGSYGAYIEVISYDKLLKNAKQQNRVLFDKLFAPKTVDLVHPELA